MQTGLVCSQFFIITIIISSGGTSRSMYLFIYFVGPVKRAELELFVLLLFYSM